MVYCQTNLRVAQVERNAIRSVSCPSTSQTTPYELTCARWEHRKWVVVVEASPAARRFLYATIAVASHHPFRIHTVTVLFWGGKWVVLFFFLFFGLFGLIVFCPFTSLSLFPPHPTCSDRVKTYIATSPPPVRWKVLQLKE